MYNIMKLSILTLVMAIVSIGCIDLNAAPAPVQNAEVLAISMIAKHEGFRSYKYVCPGGKTTIGYGFTDKDLISKGSMTRAEADRVLGKKVRKELQFLRSIVKGLNPKQEAAVVSFIYNVGRGNFLQSTFLKKLKAKDFSSAKIELCKWVHSNGTRLEGLVKRRADEARWII